MVGACSVGAQQEHGAHMTTLVSRSETVAKRTAAAHTIDAMKLYGRGETEVRALDGVTVG